MAPSFVSLFSGAGGFDIGFDAAGFRCVAQVEIDKTARAVLGRHWPDVPRYEDVRQFGAAQVPTCDVVVGGFPCQDVSTAGKRKGFEGGERSSLWFEMVRVIRELRPAYVVWENVPGLLSADEGRNFAAVLVELADLGFDGGWRTVDAQFFGVPQQRRRVFGVFARGDSGAERCAEILALAESVRRRTPPRRKAGAGVAATLTRGSGSSGVNPPGPRQEDDTNLIAVDELNQAVTGQQTDTLRAKSSCGTFVFGGGDCGGNARRAAAATLTAKAGARQDFDTENFVLIQDARAGIETKAQGGLGVRVSSVYDTLDTLGTQAVVVPATYQASDYATGGYESCEVARPLTTSADRSRSAPVAVCVTGEGVTHALTAKSGASEDGTGRGTPIVYAPSPAYCVTDARGTGDGHGQGWNSNYVATAASVRRLTPRECERLMGWPDDFTRWREDGTEIADGPRYRLCGNGVVGTVSGWLARRMMAVMTGGEA